MATLNLNQLNNKKKKEEDKGDFLKNLMTKEITIGSKELSDKKKSNFYNNLYILLSSGIDLKSTLDLMCEDVTDKEEKETYTNIRELILSGKSLSEAISQTQKFSTYETYSVKIGEETGCLDTILKELVSFYTKKIEQKRKMKSAFSYPIFVLSISIIAVIFMMVFVVPMFQDVFARFGNDLPYMTQVVINISHAISDHLIGIIIGLAAIIILFMFLQKNEKFERIKTTILLHIPFFGELLRKMYLARFSLAMSLLSSAHIPVLQALGLTKKMISFYPIRVSLEIVEEEIMKGKNLYESLRQFKIYDKRMISLIKVGEEVNQLDKVFERLKVQYMEDVDYQTSMASGIMEPLMIIIVGVFVGAILISMYLPIFKLSTSIGY